MEASRILEIVGDMANVQAIAPEAEDFTGFNNADYPLGLVLAAVADIEKASALLYLYPRQAQDRGVTAEDLRAFLPEDFSGKADARAILTNGREALAGKVAFVVKSDAVVFNGVRVNPTVTKVLRSLGEKTTAGWVIPKSKVKAAVEALGDSLLHAEGLASIIEQVPQEVCKVASAKSLITFTVEGNTIGWTFLPRNDSFMAVKEVIKNAGGRYNGNGGWDMKPDALAAAAMMLEDMNLPDVDLSALARLGVTPEILSLRDEINTDSIRVRVTPVGAGYVKLNIRKFHAEFVSGCKAAHGKYDGDGGWTVGTMTLPALCLHLSKFPQFVLEDVEAHFPDEAAFIVPTSVGLPTETPTGMPLFNHQVDDLKFLLCNAVDAKGISKFLANDMGTGKTLSAIVAANYKFPTGRFLVVVPAVAKLNWVKEIKRFVGADERIQVLVGRSAKLDETARWTIVNYDIISNYRDAMMASHYDVAILDEVHNIKTISAQRTAALIATWDRKESRMVPGILTGIPHVWCMTGTFLMNRMKELFTALRAVDHKLGKSKRSFEKRYCDGHTKHFGPKAVWMADGASNIPELAARIAPIYRKVMKKDVLDLPEKLRQDFIVEVSAADLREIEAIEQALEEALANFDEIDGVNVLPFITRLKMTTAKLKIASTIEEAEAVIDAGNKVIIFTEYTEVLQEFVKHFGEKAVHIDGSVTGAKREVAVERFQGDPSCMVLVGNIKACGVAITLTAASYVIFNDKPWNPAMAAQAEDRAYRIGQKKTVNIIYMTAPGTYDESLTEKLLSKGALVTDWESLTDAEVKALQSGKSETQEILEYIQTRKKAKKSGLRHFEKV